MALIKWQTNAKRHLKSIFDYYKKHGTYRVYYIYENDVCHIQAIWDCSMNPAKRASRILPKRRTHSKNIG